jgi:hypothetical protein
MVGYEYAVVAQFLIKGNAFLYAGLTAKTHREGVQVGLVSIHNDHLSTAL